LNLPEELTFLIFAGLLEFLWSPFLARKPIGT
jgi:hypothetical protein